LDPTWQGDKKELTRTIISYLSYLERLDFWKISVFQQPTSKIPPACGKGDSYSAAGGKAALRAFKQKK
jgi:hypothetical protein